MDLYFLEVSFVGLLSNEFIGKLAMENAIEVLKVLERETKTIRTKKTTLSNRPGKWQRIYFQ